MNKVKHYIVLILCALTLVLSVVNIGRFLHDYKVANTAYSNAARECKVPDSKEFDESIFEKFDLNALTKVNDEILGWIIIPGTNISYPIAQHGNNTYYLDHLYNKDENHVGTPFLDFQNSSDLTDFNSLIIGHTTKDKSMFSELHYYQDKSFWKDHSTIYLYSKNGLSKYMIFAAYQGSPTGPSYQCNISSIDEKKAFIDYANASSLYDTKINPDVDDQFLTLSTYVANIKKYRMIINAVKIQ